MHRIRKWLGYILLLVGTTAFGFLSGVAYPLTSGARGAIIGGVSGLGLIMLDELERYRLTKQRHPRWLAVVSIAVASGCIAGMIVILWGINKEPVDHIFETLEFETAVQSLALTVSYCAVLHITYALRRISRYLLVLMPWLIAAAGIGLFMLWDLNQHDFEDPASSFLLSLFAALPLFLGWGFAVAMFDPAFTLERWHRTRPPDEQSAK